jgi:hypothetical protein
MSLYCSRNLNKSSEYQIDKGKFQASSGDLKWLPVIATAFLRQLPQWGADFDSAIASQDLGLQLNLLHKMKGSCYAVGAYPAAESITEIEALQACVNPLTHSELFFQLALVEAELHTIIAGGDPLRPRPTD